MSKFLVGYKQILYWSVLTVAIFVPLYPKLPLFQVGGTFVSVRLEDFLIAAVLVLWAGYILLSKQIIKTLTDPVIALLLLFFGIGALSVFSGLFLTHTILVNLGLLHWLRRVELMFLLPVAATAIDSRRKLMVLLLTLSVVTLVVCFYALGQEYLHWPVISTGNSEFSKGQILYLTPGARVNSTFAGHYDLAVFLVMVLTMASSLFFAAGKKLKVYLVGLFALSFVILVMTAARLSFVATVVGVFLSLLFLGKTKFILVLIILAIFALAYPSQLQARLISTVTVNLLHKGQRYNATDLQQNKRSNLNIPTLATGDSTRSAEASKVASRSAVASDITPGEPIDTTQLGVYRSFEIRLNNEWPRALTAFLKNPFLGTGYSSLGLATDNDFLRSLGEVGLLGTIAFGLVLVAVVRKIFANLRSADKFKKAFWAGTLAMIAAVIINGTFIDVFEASKVATLFWLMLGVGLAALP